MRAALLLASCATLPPPVPDDRGGVLPPAWEALVAEGCALEGGSIQVRTAVEARALAAMPAALAGEAPADEALDTLLRADGGWYPPAVPHPPTAAEQACAARLQAALPGLRAAVPLPRAFEDRLLREPANVDRLLSWATSSQHSPYAAVKARRRLDGTWVFSSTYPWCLGELDCGGYAITCAPGALCVGVAGG